MGQKLRNRKPSPNMVAVWDCIQLLFEPGDKFDGHKVWDVAFDKKYFLNVDRAHVSHALKGLSDRGKLISHGYAVYGLKPPVAKDK